MNPSQLQKETTHRPWPLPKSKWKYYQEWNDAIFLHWSVEKRELEKYIPKGLKIDTINGQAWVSIVAFTMEKIRPRYLPSFQPISYFHEINIRTYVVRNNKPGVYFLSIEGGKYWSCKIAKYMSGLPYRYSNIIRKSGKYISNNLQYKDHLNIEFKIKNKLTEKTNLDKWLTERYALFQDAKKSINRFEIHHLEWEINKIEIGKLELKYDRFQKLFFGKPDISHYSKGVKVIAWGENET